MTQSFVTVIIHPAHTEDLKILISVSDGVFNFAQIQSLSERGFISLSLTN